MLFYLFYREKETRFIRTGTGSLFCHPTTLMHLIPTISTKLTSLRHKPCFSINDSTLFVQHSPTPSIRPLHGSQGHFSSTCLMDRSEASHSHTGNMSPTLNSEVPRGRPGPPSDGGGEGSRSHEPASMSLYSWSMKASSCSRS